MTAAIAAGRRFLPRGYADFARQLLIWFGFLAAYQVARGVADRNPTRAFENGWRVIDVEQRVIETDADLASRPAREWPVSSECTGAYAKLRRAFPRSAMCKAKGWWPDSRASHRAPPRPIATWRGKSFGIVSSEAF